MADDDYQSVDEIWDEFERPMSSSGLSVNPLQNVAFIRTSDRTSFRRCRRKWNWSYVHRGNREARRRGNPLWLGSAFHFAMEDFHGYNQFGKPSEAIKAYAKATRAVPGGKDSVPEDWEELTDLGVRMLDYYSDYWLKLRDPLKTFVYQGKPQVEVRFEIDIPFDASTYGFDRVVYQGTFDRVVEDEYGRLWILDYKTAKVFQTGHFDIDSQVSTYCWAGNHLYDGRKIEGFIYQQHKKTLPSSPKFLKTTRMFSTANNQSTSHPMYREALLGLYGDIKRAPAANIEFLNNLAAEEGEGRDKYIRRDFLERGEAICRAQSNIILAEVSEMLNPNTLLYPNPTRDCSWDCSFYQACVNMDNDMDWQYEIEDSTVDRTEQGETWRNYLQLPNQQSQEMTLELSPPKPQLLLPPQLKL